MTNKIIKKNIFLAIITNGGGNLSTVSNQKTPIHRESDE